MASSNIKILVIEDEEKLSDVVKSYLENSGYSVRTAYNGKEALKMFDQVNPSLIILDLMLPDVSGEEICRTIRRKSTVPIVMLTAKVEEEDIIAGLDIGADDYITKPFRPRQLVARVAALLRRSLIDKTDRAEILVFNEDLVVDSQKHEVKKQGKAINLTPNEYKILLTLIKNSQKAFTREELISIALEGNFEGFDRTIDSHIKNLRQKIETNPKQPQYILTVHGVGYRFGGE
ncbi:response regulator transcription factor [Geosporobacter ferrireducens]|uniref:Stage 0 sporulation protein A homolog n=1 Tax=Geosporobacter ferrireducens TaxID=1424294 RepID=A0A1D8GE19_9FIRM|nr:response regulator transcription factor [Geosporobacter ferrireducens]AOT69164.1 DNA-binding response regulator [Geosporobacter ferrireducens]MTI56841.1 response regulator transcription factor [Geosporobacter ferrireducens]